MQTNFHNTTNLSGDELKKKDASAKSQEVNIYELMVHLQKQVEWWTSDALNREFERRFGKKLKPQSISRALSNLSAYFCTGCRQYHTGTIKHANIDCCPKCSSFITTHQQPKLMKSDTAMFRSEEGDRVHAWRLAPDPGQADLFPMKEGLTNEF